MLTRNIYKETQSISNGSTSTTITLKVPHFVVAQYIFVRDAAANDGPADNSISNIKVSMTGRTIIDVPGKVITYEEGFYNCAHVSDTNTRLGDNKVYTIFYGEQKPIEGYNSGGVAFSNINNPQITVTHEDPGNATHELVVVSEYLQLTNVNPDDGRVQISYSL